MIDPQHVTHALVDGVRFPRAMEHLARRKGVGEIEPLYQLTPYQQLAEHGPILVGLAGSALVEDALATSDGPLIRGVSWLSSGSDTETLGDHLRQFVEITGAGTRRLFRFADPLVIRHWLASYGDEVPADVLGPIATWWLPLWSPNWAPTPRLTWPAFHAAIKENVATSESTTDEPPIPPSHFGSAQLDSFQAVRHWQFKESLTEHFRGQAHWRRLEPETRGEWLDTRIAEAAAWGLTTQRDTATWIDLALRWGDDFMTRHNGPYAQWREQRPEAERMSRVQRFAALDAWRDTYHPDSERPPV